MCRYMRAGNTKSAFNYVLIDPRLTANLPVRAKQERLSERDVLAVFVGAIFYVGKGSRARPYAHLYDACRYWKGERGRGVDAVLAAQSNVAKRVRCLSHHYDLELLTPHLGRQTKKIERILSIWDDNQGVVSLHCFQSVISSEAYTREAAMIDALGLSGDEG